MEKDFSFIIPQGIFLQFFAQFIQKLNNMCYKIFTFFWVKAAS